MTIVWSALKSQFGRRLLLFGLMTSWRIAMSPQARQMFRLPRAVWPRHRVTKRERVFIKTRNAVARVRM
jgi:hypothetical protein